MGFSYEDIDSIPESFYADVFDENGLVKIPLVKRVYTTSSGKNITVKASFAKNLTGLWNNYARYITGKDDVGYVKVDLYDPFSVSELLGEDHRDEFRGSDIVAFVPSGTSKLTDEQVKHRVLVFVKMMHLATDQKVFDYLYEHANKKKDGMLNKNGITHIATMMIQDYYLKDYEMVAKANKEDELTISCTSRSRICSSIYNNCDLVCSSDMFKNL